MKHLLKLSVVSLAVALSMFFFRERPSVLANPALELIEKNIIKSFEQDQRVALMGASGWREPDVLNDTSLQIIKKVELWALQLDTYEWNSQFELYPNVVADLFPAPPNTVTETVDSEKSVVQTIEEGLLLYDSLILPAGDSGTELQQALASEAIVYLYEVINLPPHESTTQLRSLAYYALADLGFQLWYSGKSRLASLFAVSLIATRPGSELAQFAWLKLNSFIHLSYSGTSGDSTPKDWLNFLSDLYTVSFYGYPEDELPSVTTTASNY